MCHCQDGQMKTRLCMYYVT